MKARSWYGLWGWIDSPLSLHIEFKLSNTEFYFMADSRFFSVSGTFTVAELAETAQADLLDGH